MNLDQTVFRVLFSGLAIPVKATFVLAAGIAAVWFATRSRASVRHFLLVATFASLVVVPLVARFSTGIVIRTPATVAEDTSAPVQDHYSAANVGTLAVTNRKQEKKTDWPGIVRIAWMIVTMLLLVRSMIELFRLWHLRRTGQRWEPPLGVVRALPSDHAITFLQHEEISTPVTFGFLRPVIMLPTSADDWTGSELRCALLHELEHVRRSDFAVLFAVRVICACYWFHPLAWYARRRLSLEAERACDDAVVAREDIACYAEQLISLARHVTDSTLRYGVGMVRRSDLAARVAALIDQNQSRGRLGIRAALGSTVGAALIVLTIAPIAIAQAPRNESAPTGQSNNAAPLPSFEAASIRRHIVDPNVDELINRGCGRDVSRCTPVNVTVKNLIELAYSMRDFQVLGGPSWIESDRFNIEAKVDDADARKLQGLLRAEQQAQTALMMRSLLADRFKLKVVYGSKELPAYSLVITRGGSKLVEAPPDKPGAAVPLAAPPSPGRVGDSLAPAPGQSLFAMDGGLLTLEGKAVPLATLISALSRQLGQQIVDQTGLTGVYDYKLKFTPENGPQGESLSPEDRAEASNSSGASIFTALQEQLGLKLETTKAPVDTITIEHIEQPTEN